MRIIYCACLLILSVYPGPGVAWDFATATGERIQFFNNNGSGAGIVSEEFSEMTALSYDPVYRTLYFSDTGHSNATIFSYHLTENKGIQHIVGKSNGENVLGIAFDPVSRILFWTGGAEKNIIFWLSLVPGSESKAAGAGRVLMELKNETLQGITIDSCRGFIYWTNIHPSRPTIERATLEGKNRQVIIEGDLYRPVSITLDQATKRIYWIDDKQGSSYNLESANLDGSDRKIFYSGMHHQPYGLAIGDNTIYWTDWAYKSVWKLPLSSNGSNVEPDQINLNTFPMGIISRINILEKIEAIEECKILNETIHNRTNTLQKIMFSSEEHNQGIISNIQNPVFSVRYCLNGGNLRQTKEDILDGNKVCICPKGFSGDRCEISFCHNYCLSGSCILDSRGLPTCRCVKGFRGERCEEDICNGYCLNEGLCKLDPIEEPACQCPSGWGGKRCEAKKVPTRTTSTTASPPITTATPPPITPCSCSDRDQDTNRVFVDQRLHRVDDPQLSNSSSIGLGHSNQDDYSEPNKCYDFDVKEPIIMGLSVFCVLLSITSCFLAAKVIMLRRRPRIKKRIIVNKNVTPLTCRPDPPQCEITIENCCNMNICETPCFEPEGLRAQLSDTGKKDEKKNLLLNMERQDDLY